jgi:hypothetical protein
MPADARSQGISGQVAAGLFSVRKAKSVDFAFLHFRVPQEALPFVELR